MSATEDSLETYTHLPLHLDPATKVLSSTKASDSQLQEMLNNINALHNQFKALETPNYAPPAPLPVNPKRTAQLTKLRESAGQSVRKNDYAGAIRLFTLALQMAADRPPWEPAGLVREELAVCYMERANVHILNRDWVEGFKDAECSTECKRGKQQGPQGQQAPGNPRAFTIGGKCLVEMGRWEEAVTWLERGLELEGTEGPDGKEMQRLLGEAREAKKAVVAKYRAV
ncbi:hypothetical protein LTR70_004793 [Exophiala xenobiotica]|uniref:Uncharacterized protein n=1 Tax=Lithohypha guttulata TaxID=1690604 RepID=A0ABR0KCE7_9EURO|nr:hypothetical protein LTR24_004285 [Lithohypha guttulata]KAK5319883.1 hypothetical protein LTR70_004793 [Exophiala xenobiotica]